MTTSDVETALEFRERARENLKNVLQPLLNEAMQEHLAPYLMQPLYEIVVRQLGIIDGYAAMLGVPREARLETMRCHLKEARVAVLESHNSVCPGCESAATLEAELAAEH